MVHLQEFFAIVSKSKLTSVLKDKHKRGYFLGIFPQSFLNAYSGKMYLHAAIFFCQVQLKNQYPVDSAI